MEILYGSVWLSPPHRHRWWPDFCPSWWPFCKYINVNRFYLKVIPLIKDPVTLNYYGFWACIINFLISAIYWHIGSYSRVRPFTRSAAWGPNVRPPLVRPRWPRWMGNFPPRCWIHIWTGISNSDFTKLRFIIFIRKASLKYYVSGYFGDV